MQAPRAARPHVGGPNAPACSAAPRPEPPLPRRRAAALPPSPPPEQPPPPLWRRAAAAAGLAGAAAALSLSLGAGPAAAATPFLKATGARGPLAEEEAALVALRAAKEGAVREEISELKREFEAETARSQREGQLCATPFGVDVVGITEFIALTGALVGGVSARRRKDELERLNEQLRTINTQLRQQARAGIVYAPGLTYAPPGGGDAGGGGVAVLEAPPEAPPAAAPPQPWPKPSFFGEPPTSADDAAAPGAAPSAAAAAAAAAPAAPPAAALNSVDEEEAPEVQHCRAALREGKRLLKESNPGAAMVRFEKALMLARAQGDALKEKRATRGLAAAARLAGNGRAALRHLSRVLELSAQMGDHVGDADAYGTIADVYTELGEFERAAEFYDKYIDTMKNDGPV